MQFQLSSCSIGGSEVKIQVFKVVTLRLIYRRAWHSLNEVVMKFSHLPLLSVIVLAGCSSTPEPPDADDNIMFMGMNIQQPTADTTKKSSSKKKHTKETINNAESIRHSELANDSPRVPRVVTINVDSESDSIIIKSDSNNRVKEWRLKGVQNLHTNNIDAIVKQVPEYDRQELEGILTNIDYNPHLNQTFDDNLMFMDTTEQRYVISETVEVETAELMPNDAEARPSAPEPLTTIIVDLIKTANLSVEDKDKIRKALNMN